MFRIVFDYLYGENMYKGKFISHSEGVIKMLKGGLKFSVCVCSGGLEKSVVAQWRAYNLAVYN